MTRVCFIGDSHLATLKFGLPFVERDLPNVEATFFASHGKSMRRLSLSGNTLIATNDTLTASLEKTSGGQNTIHDGYDVYLVHGLELSIITPLLLMQSRAIDQALEDLVATAVGETIAVGILAMVRKITAAPIFLSPAPMSYLLFPALREHWVRRGRNDSFVRMFESACRKAAGNMNATFLPQPLGTRDADGLATKSIHSQHPARFGAALVVEDKSHMNADYGAAVLRDFFAAASLPSR